MLKCTIAPKAKLSITSDPDSASMHGHPPSPSIISCIKSLLIHSIRFRVLSGQGSFLRRQSRWLVILILLLATLTLSLAQPGGSELEFALIFSRHGVRSPTKPNSEYAQYAAQEWPTWPVCPGHLTPNGKKLMILLGAYYREYFTSDLLWVHSYRLYVG
jgi:hypothetical protein